MKNRVLLITIFIILICTGFSYGAEENASNPLAAVNNTDLRIKFIDLTSGQDRTTNSVEGAYMFAPKF